MFFIFFHRIRTNFNSEKSASLSCLVHHFIPLQSRDLSVSSKQCSLNFGFILPWSVFHILDILFCKFALIPAFFTKVDFNNCHIMYLPPLSSPLLNTV